MEFKAFEDGIEVNGATVYSFVAGFKLIKSLPINILKKYRIGSTDDSGEYVINEDDWFPQQAWLDSFREISEKMGDIKLFEIGKQIPENAEFPPWVQDIESAVKSIDIAYHMNHRKNGEVMFNPETGTMLEGIGHYGYEKVDGENKIINVCENPYPCDFDRGIISFMAEKFNKNAKVVHDDSKECRKKTKESCTYIITW